MIKREETCNKAETSSLLLKPSVLVFGGGLQGLSVCRSLWKSGYRVVCMASPQDPISKYKFVHHFVSDAQEGNDISLLEWFCRLVVVEGCSVILPMGDKAAEFLSKNKCYIEQQTKARCAVPEYEVFSLAYNKSMLLSFCAEHHLPHPKTFSLTESNLIEAADIIGFPALIKPDYSVGARGITLVRNREEFLEKVNAVIATYGTCSLQEYVEHAGRPYYNVMIYRDTAGKTVACAIIEIIRYYPIKGGSSTMARTIEAPALVGICEQVLRELHYVGFADFDVLRTKEGEYKIIEINPRVPASLRAAEVSGINFPDIIVRDLLAIPQPSFNYQAGKYLRYLGLDLLWFIASPNRWHARPNWFHFFGKNLYYQEGGAFFSSFYSGIKKFMNPALRKSKRNN